MSTPRKILYVVSRFPNVSTTFTAHEMAQVATLGIAVHVATVWKESEGNEGKESEGKGTYITYLAAIIVTSLRTCRCDRASSPPGETPYLTARPQSRRPRSAACRESFRVGDKENNEECGEAVWGCSAPPYTLSFLIMA